MREHFDTLAWTLGLGSWICSAISIFALITAFELSPFWFTLSFPVPFATVAVLYQLRLKTLPKLSRQLGSVDERKRKEAFKRLMAMGQSAVDAFLQVFQMPLKKAEVGDWDGVSAAILAVEGLGRLKAKKAVPQLLMLLRSSELEVCEKAIWALGEIGDNTVIPELLPFLGSEKLGKVTATSLGKLGASDLVDLFKLALARNKSAIEAIRRHRFRDAFVAGFIRALWNLRDISSIPNAAWALAELWATEAIPALRAQVTRWLPTEIREACQQALAKLEMVSKLPKAVSPSEFDTSTLPRPASISRSTFDNLPRAANVESSGAQNY